MVNSVFIFGPSCSGKSTLGKALQKSMGSSWTYIDRDFLIESNACVEGDADTALERKIQEVGKHIIIDAQIPWRKKRQGEIYCLLLPPLQTLLERDANRTKSRKRTEKRAFWAKNYVIETHDILSKTDKNEFEIYLNSSRLSVNKEVSTIKNVIESKRSQSWISYMFLAIVGLSFTVALVLHKKE